MPAPALGGPSEPCSSLVWQRLLSAVVVEPDADVVVPRAVVVVARAVVVVARAVVVVVRAVVVVAATVVVVRGTVVPTVGALLSLPHAASATADSAAMPTTFATNTGAV